MLFSTGKFPWLMRKALFETHQSENRFRPRGRLLFRDSLDQTRHHRIFQRGEFGKQMMKLKDKSDLTISKKGKILFIQGIDVFSFVKNLSRSGPIERA